MCLLISIPVSTGKIDVAREIIACIPGVEIDEKPQFAVMGQEYVLQEGADAAPYPIVITCPSIGMFVYNIVRWHRFSKRRDRFSMEHPLGCVVLRADRIFPQELILVPPLAKGLKADTVIFGLNNRMLLIADSNQREMVVMFPYVEAPIVRKIVQQMAASLEDMTQADVKISPIKTDALSPFPVSTARITALGGIFSVTQQYLQCLVQVANLSLRRITEHGFQAWEPVSIAID